MGQTYIDQQTKIDEQNASIKNKDRENLTLKHKNESLEKENSTLRNFKGLLLEIANADPEIKDMIANEIPELRSKFTKDDTGMEMGQKVFLKFTMHSQPCEFVVKFTRPC